MRCLLPLLLLAGTVFAQTWSDGTPITRFDKQNGVAMAEVASFEGLTPRHWAVPEIWANRTQDWDTVSDNLGGWYAATNPQRLPCRTAHWLTYELADVPGPFRMEAVIRATGLGDRTGWAGFLIGAGQGQLDYRGAALVHHMPGYGGGLLAVIETAGEGGLRFREMSQPEVRLDYPELPGQQTIVQKPIDLGYHQMTLNLEGVPSADGTYLLRLSVWARHSGELFIAQELPGVPAARLRGNVAFAASPGGPNTIHYFGYPKAGGERLVHHPERTFGPCAGTLYTVSDQVLRLSAQFMSLGEATLPGQGQPRMAASLAARPLGSDGEFQTLVGPTALAPPDYYVLFDVPRWDSTRAWETRVVFADERGQEHYYRTIIQAEPSGPQTKVAGFTGMGVIGRLANAPGPRPQEGEAVFGRWTHSNVWLPFEQAVANVQKQAPDLLCFTGDQIYEGKPTMKDSSRTPWDDYLYKWILWHWSFNPLTNHIPAVCQPDDHDVYHGNLWGMGGELSMDQNVNKGGYGCSPYFVNMVHRTQCGHLPPAWDPAPIKNGITNYYTGFVWGGVGFAILEDRKFKTPGQITDPAQQEQLGDAQLEFLKAWGEDWRGQVFKCAVSQTIYAGMHVNFDGALSKDSDTNGFPKSERDKSVRMFQRAGMFVLSGDQHLATFSRLGLDRPGDAVYDFAVPALGNIFWRWFYPNQPGENRNPGEPEYLGDFVDEWGNPFRMLAVANPERATLLSQKLRQRQSVPLDEAAASYEIVTDADGTKVAVGGRRACLGDGYGIVTFDREARTVTVACWPHNVDPTTGQPFAGWPQTLPQSALDGRAPVAWLPDLTCQGLPDPVVKIIDQESGEVVSVTRAAGGQHRPYVFDAGRTYTLVVGRPEAPAVWREYRDLKPAAQPGQAKLEVDLR